MVKEEKEDKRDAKTHAGTTTKWNPISLETLAASRRFKPALRIKLERIRKARRVVQGSVDCHAYRRLKLTGVSAMLSSWKEWP